MPSSPESVSPAAGSLLRHRDFLRLWTAQSISVLGDTFSELAVPLIAVLILQAGPAQMGILTAMYRAPYLLFGLLAGVWVDRLPRRPILIVSDLGRGLLLSTIPLVAFTGSLRMPQLYAVAFLVGILSLFFDIAHLSYLPSLVDRSQLVEGNSKLETTRSIAQLTGPGLAGVVIQTLSAPVAILFDAISFFLSALFIAQINQQERPAAAPPRPLLSQIRDGLGFVLGDPSLRSLAGYIGTSNLFSTSLFSLFILFATRDLRLTPAAIGAVFSLGSIGSVVGAIMAGHLARRFGTGRTLVGGAFLASVGWLPIVFATPHRAFLLIGVCNIVGLFGVLVFNINSLSLRQAITPLGLQGHVNASMRFLVWGTMPLGAIIGGTMGELLGLRPAIGMSAAGSLSALLWVVFSRIRTLQTIPEPSRS